MKNERHLTPTGNAVVDRILGGLVGVFEIAFPDRIRSYYIEGSQADQTGLATSDIDINILFKESLETDERRKAFDLADSCGRLSAMQLDIDILDEQRAAKGIGPALKLASTLIYGEDTRDQLPIIPLQDWARERTHIAYWLMIKVFGRPPLVTLPLGYPDPADEFCGYTQRKLRLPDGSEAYSTRDLIRVVGWIATALVALKGGQYVSGKRDSHRMYREYVSDQWADLLEDVYRKCRGEWQYVIPEHATDREQLQAICGRTLEFENHFLSIYKSFLLSEIRTGDAAAKRHILWLLGEIVYNDPEITDALSLLLQDEDHELRQAAQQTLTKIEAAQTTA